MVVNNFKVSHGLALGCPSEVHIQLGLAGSLGQHREVSRLSNFHTWKPPPKEMVMRNWKPINHNPTTPQFTPAPSLPRHLPVRLSPGPSALTLLASWDGSTLMWKGLAGISWMWKSLDQVFQGTVLS